MLVILTRAVYMNAQVKVEEMQERDDEDRKKQARKTAEVQVLYHMCSYIIHAAVTHVYSYEDRKKQARKTAEFQVPYHMCNIIHAAHRDSVILSKILNPKPSTPKPSTPKPSTPKKEEAV